LDGHIGQEEWPDFQLDGYGAWLWGLVEFVRTHGDNALWQEVSPAVAIVVRYITALWQSPNYDCWEEHRNHIHPATLAALYGGLCAVQSVASELVPDGLPEAIRDFVLANAVASDGHFMKYLGNDAVDPSLLWIALPYKLVDVHDQRFLATLEKIERDIYRPGGGVYRYHADTYYGGGEWLLLTLWLAWTYLELGRHQEAANLVAWVESQASSSGEMPEQVSEHLLAAGYYETWVARWGEVATPLLWSHGMYLLLKSLISRNL
jgi:GH15 family glucan-1,4-alpha-glucosidase